MKQVAEHVQIEEEELKLLVEKFGKPTVKKKIKTLNDRRAKGTLTKSGTGSDMRSLTQIGNQQKVLPIKDKDLLEDVRSYFETRSKRDYFLFVMGINIGVRVGDLLKLQVKDVKAQAYLSFREEKTGKTKRFRINPLLRGIIDTYITEKDPQDYLFPSKKTKEPISRVQAYRIMRDAGEALGLESIGTHSLRKSFGFHLYQKTKDIALLQEIFNHSSERVTKIYIGIAQDEIDKVIDDFFI